MDALYRYGAAYGMGEEPPQSSGEPGQPVEVEGAQAAQPAPAAQPSTWESIKSISSSLIAQGVQVAPSYIQAKLDAAKNKKSSKKAKSSKSKTTKAFMPPPARAGLPGWVIPVVLGGAAVVGLVFFLRRRKG